VLALQALQLSYLGGFKVVNQVFWFHSLTIFLLRLVELNFLFAKELNKKMASTLPVGEVGGGSFGTVEDVVYQDVLMVSLSYSGVWREQCGDPNENGKILCCSFHPRKPKLACGFDDGRVVVFSATNQSDPTTPWDTKLVYQTKTRDRVTCVEWNVR
jgi:hypothetical protein